MKYKNGESVLLGDIVNIKGSTASVAGVVRAVLLAGTEEALNWSAPLGGVLIEGGGLGLFVTTHPEQDEDVTLVSRAPAFL